jgi:hypothetical protein
MAKGQSNEASFAEIERERARLQRVQQLPPLEKIKQVDSSNMLKTSQTQLNSVSKQQQYIIPQVSALVKKNLLTMQGNGKSNNT